jgi:hypothetical protein
MGRRLLILPAVAVALLLAGCGGSSSNGEAEKSASQILADAKRAAIEAGSVKVRGTIEDQGTAIALDLLVGTDGGSGTMTIQGSKIDIIRIGNVVYLRAGADFYRQVGAGKGAGQLLDGRWLKVASTSADFKDLASFTDIDQFMKNALKPEGKISKGGETTVSGSKAIELKDSKGGSLFVATTGKPYPVEFHGGGTTSGKLVLTDFGAAVKPKAPKNPVDLAKLGG